MYLDIIFYDITYFDFFCCFTLFQDLRWADLFSYIIICNTDISNWKIVDTSRKYLNSAWLLSGFKVGVGNSYLSRININYLPTDAMLRITLVTYIETLFHAY